MDLGRLIGVETTECNGNKVIIREYNSGHRVHLCETRDGRDRVVCNIEYEKRDKCPYKRKKDR